MADAPTSIGGLGRIAVAAIVIISLVAGVGFIGSFEGVNAGHVKVVTDKGEVTGEVFSPGWYFINPVTQNAHSISVRPQEYTMSATQGEGEKVRNDQVNVLTNNGLEVGVDVTIRYSVNPEQADTFYRQYRTLGQAEQRLIRPAVRSELRTEAGNIQTNQIYTKSGQEQLRTAVKDVLQQEFEGSGLELQAVQIRGIDLPQEYQQSIEQKEIEQQRIEQKEAQIERERLEKERKIIEAEGEAEQNRIISESLTDEVLMNRYIEAIDSNSKIIITGSGGGSGGTPFILDSDTLDSSDVDDTDLTGNSTAPPSEGSSVDTSDDEQDENDTQNSIATPPVARGGA